MKISKHLQIAAVAATIVFSQAALRADVVTHYEYDAAGQVTRQYVEDTSTAEILSETRTEYDNLGRVWRMRQLATPDGAPNDATDRITETGFDQAGNVTSRRRRVTTGDALTVYGYDFANRRASMTDPESGVTTYDHDDRGNVVYVLGPMGNESRFTFDAGGRQTDEKRYEQTTLDLHVVSEFDSRDNKIKETAFDAAATPLTQKRWEFDSLGRSTRRIQMADPASVAGIDLTTDRVTDVTYDSGSARVATETRYADNPAVARTTQYGYDSIGRLTLITDANGNTEQRAYNVYGQVDTRTITEPPLGARSFTYAYDNLGRTTSETADGPPALTTSYEYDALDRQSRMTDAEEIATDYAYNAFGEQTLVTEDADGATPRQTESQYNQLGHQTLHRTWDGEGLTETTTYEHDLMGRRTRIDFCDGGAWVYVYDDAGRMTQRTDPRSQVSVYTHNWRGQILTKTVDAQLEDAFDYTPLGWMTLAQRDVNNQVVFGHDAFGQVTSQTQTLNGIAKTVGYDHNQAGNRTQLDYPADTGVVLIFDYDALGQSTAIQRNGQPLADYTYAGRFLTNRDTRTTSAIATWIRHHVDYDVHRRKTAITNSADVDGAVTELDHYDYTYDNVGNRETADVTGDPDIADSITYGYDDFHHLTSAAYTSDSSNEVFGYDLLGNRLTYNDRDGADTTYDHNCVNEYTDITPGGNDPEHDAAGNLTRTESDYDLAYDYENRLIEVRNPSDVTIATYTYDALGRRVEQVKDSQTTRFYYDGENVVAEYDDTDTLQRYYVHGPTYVDEHLLIREHDRDFYYLLAALYSVSGLADEDGQVVERYTYDAYGLPTIFDGSAARTLRNGCGGLDADGDGDIDLADYALFADCITGPAGPLLGDFDSDGDVDLNDYAEFYACLSGPQLPAAADLDQDGDVDLEDFAAWVTCLQGPGVVPPGDCSWANLDSDDDVDLADYGAFIVSFGGGLAVECQVFDAEPDGDVDLADFGSFCVVFTGAEGPLPPTCVIFDTEPDGDVDLADFAVFETCFTGSISHTPANPYYFTGRRLDFDIRDVGGRPLLALYHYRARGYDAWHGRFLQKDPAAFPITDVSSLARKALAVDQLRRVLTDMLRAGLTKGPWTTLRPLFESSIDPRAAYTDMFGIRREGMPAGLYASHLDGLNLYQYARSNPNAYLDPGGRWSLGESLITSAIAAGLFGMAVDSPSIVAVTGAFDLSGGQVALLYVTSFFTNAASALGPWGTAGGSLAKGMLNQWITNWSLELSAGDIANILTNTAIGFASGKTAGLRGGMVDWPDATTSIAAAELSSILNSIWGWVTPF